MEVTRTVPLENDLEAELVAAYSLLARRLTVVLKDADGAADVAQSAFAGALERRAQFRSGDVRAWLYTADARLSAGRRGDTSVLPDDHPPPVPRLPRGGSEGNYDLRPPTGELFTRFVVAARPRVVRPDHLDAKTQRTRRECLAAENAYGFGSEYRSTVPPSKLVTHNEPKADTTPPASWLCGNSPNSRI